MIQKICFAYGPYLELKLNFKETFKVNNERLPRTPVFRNTQVKVPIQVTGTMTRKVKASHTQAAEWKAFIFETILSSVVLDDSTTG